MLSFHGTFVLLFECLLALASQCQLIDAAVCVSFICSEENQGEIMAGGGQGRLWEGGIVPYQYESNLRAEIREAFSEAMAMWERETCIQFVNRTTEEDYLKLGEGDQCKSEAVGRYGGGQLVVLSLQSGCGSTGHALHELGHALGFWHEHARLDRDMFVRIHWWNILCQFCQNFIAVGDNSTLDMPYDLGSIMHYNLRQHAWGGASIEVLTDTAQPPPCTKIGQRNALSSLDVLKTNVLYNCTQELERPPKDDCQLQREANPPGYILTGDTVTFSGAQGNICLCCSTGNCSLKPCTNSSRPTEFSILTASMTYRSRIYNRDLVVVAGSNGSWLDCSCSDPPCSLNICPEGEKKVKGFCVRHLFTIRFEDKEAEDGEHEGLQSGSEVSLVPAAACPETKTRRMGLESLIATKLD